MVVLGSHPQFPSSTTLIYAHLSSSTLLPSLPTQLPTGITPYLSRLSADDSEVVKTEGDDKSAAAAEPMDDDTKVAAATIPDSASDEDDEEAEAAKLAAAQRKVDRNVVGAASFLNDLPRYAPLI